MGKQSVPQLLGNDLTECFGVSEDMVSVDHVSMVFNMASQQLNNLKEYFIAIAKRELMFKEFKALDDVSFKVRKGDVYGILGTNGSGKSTMLKIIAGVLEPSEGTVRVKGNIAPLIELGAGFDHELTARENIYLNGSLLGYSHAFIEQHFNQIVDFAEIGDFLDIPLKNYSSGMVARIAFAIATIIVPDILIVDEVLSVGDFMFQQKCENRIQELIDEHGVTVLIVSHSTDQIERLCNKAIWIEKGHMRMVGEAAAVCRAYRALAGHKGSPEAEREMFSLLMELDDADEGGLKEERIVAEDRYATEALLLERCEFENDDTAIIVPGDDLACQTVGVGLAGAFKCPVIKTRHDNIESGTRVLLERFAPCKAIVLNTEAKIESRVISEIEEITQNGCDVIEGESNDIVAAKAYKMLCQRGVLAEPPFACSTDGIRKALGILPQIYLTGTPVLLEKDGEISGELNEIIGSIPSDKTARIVFSSPNPGFDSGAAAVMASSVDAGFFCFDHNDLDEFIWVIHELGRIRERVREIIFVGGEASFSSLDKALIRRALVADDPPLVPSE